MVSVLLEAAEGLGTSRYLHVMEKKGSECDEILLFVCVCSWRKIEKNRALAS